MDFNMYRRFSSLSSGVDTGEDQTEETTIETEQTESYQSELETIIENQNELIEKQDLVYQGIMNILLCIVFFFVFKFLYKQLVSWFNGS